MSGADEQARLIDQARRLLFRAGVNLQDEDGVRRLLSQPRDMFSPGASRAPSDSEHASALDTGRPLHDYVAAALKERTYEPPPARVYSAGDIRNGRNVVTAKTTAHAFIDHPYGAFVEYPETGAREGEVIAHRFPVDPERPFLPHHAFQYSLGTGTHGAFNGTCALIRDDMSQVPCRVYSYSCSSVNECSFHGSGDVFTDDTHSFTSPSRQAAARLTENISSGGPRSADHEVFEKTLAFYSALRKLGCSLKDDDRYNDGGESEEEKPRAPVRHKCAGKLILRLDHNGRTILQCEHRSVRDKAHLELRDIQGYDIDYLKALMDDDQVALRLHEERAAGHGYGPLAACSHVCSGRSQSTMCPRLHRTEERGLAHGALAKAAPCKAKFRIYVPDDLHANPNVVVLCISPHSHAAPERSMTPPAIREAFKSMLTVMDWQLAYATPRRVVQDSGFMTALRHSLKWTDSRNPVLADLHPSLANLDHTAYLIDSIRRPQYPFGTDFKGAQFMAEQQLLQPRADRYVRYAREVILPGEKEPVKIVICMSPTQSKRLLNAKRVEIDSAYNRVQSWIEFEMEEWDTTTSQSVTLCRAFIDSQSAEAHQVLFREIFRIAEEDTGLRAQFRHLHGCGIEVVTADEHKGQAKGLGLFLVEIATELLMRDPYEPQKRLCDLTAYDHLARLLRLCVVHFKRNILKLKGHVAEPVLAAMFSLASTEPHADFEGAKDIIRRGGKKAADWLHDKEKGAPFALPALYFPLCKMPLNVWLAGKSNSNGVEQKHRNVNRDGKHLSMIGGIHLGMQHDVREHRSGEVVVQEGIHPRYRPSHDAMREERSLQRHIRSHKRKLAADENTQRRPTKKARSLAGPIPAPVPLLPSLPPRPVRYEDLPEPPFLVPSQLLDITNDAEPPQAGPSAQSSFPVEDFPLFVFGQAEEEWLRKVWGPCS